MKEVQIQKGSLRKGLWEEEGEAPLPVAAEAAPHLRDPATVLFYCACLSLGVWATLPLVRAGTMFHTMLCPSGNG